MAYAASWKGAPFMMELLSSETIQWDKEQIETARLTRRVASACALFAGFLAVVGMIKSKHWLSLAESSEDATLGWGTSVGPLGTVVEEMSTVEHHQRYMEWTFTACEAKEHAEGNILPWLQYYGLCMNDAATHSAAILAVYRGWFGAIGSLVGGLLGLTENCALRFAVIGLFSGCFGLLSSLICFLNWRYVTELLFEQAFVFGLDKPAASSTAVVELIARGPVKMTYGLGLYLVVTAFIIDTFSLISLMVVNKRNILGSSSMINQSAGNNGTGLKEKIERL